MRLNEIQEIVDRAVQIATEQAVNGTPVERIIYIQPTSATQREGGFAIVPWKNNSASATPPWRE